MDVFQLLDNIIADYSKYISSFIEISDRRIRNVVENEIRDGILWPAPLIQLNPSFAWGNWIDELVSNGVLHAECGKIFRIDKSEQHVAGRPMRLYQHQLEAIEAAASGDNYVLTTGTGSGKSLSYIVPIVNHVLREGSGKGIKAIIVYPMNALANSQELELRKFLCHGYEDKPPVTFRRYTGQEGEQAREEIVANPPDILLTNYVMLELILTRPYEKKLVAAARGSKFLVFDELHTYRGRQGADVAMLIRRLRDAVTPTGEKNELQYVGTSATLAGPGTFDEQRRDVAAVASKLFGAEVMERRVIVETLSRETVCADFGSERFNAALVACIDQRRQDNVIQDYATFVGDPLSVWIENRLGLEKKSDRLVRCKPLPLTGPRGADQLLAGDTGLPVNTCVKAIQKALLQGCNIKNPDTGKPTFAFKLHQFLSKGDTVYATPEPEEVRSITLHGQKFAPDREEKVVLFPLQFCRECGQEYYCVWRIADTAKQTAWFASRNPTEAMTGVGEAGYLFISETAPWPSDFQEQAERLPDDWIEQRNGEPHPVKNRKKYLPEKVNVMKDGTCCSSPSSGGATAWFIPTPFIFCLRCQVAYELRVSDFAKLATLGTEGRSTATTVLSMSTVRHLRQESALPSIARKLLCFTDNRQDVSLQAGHFNDFIEIGLIRSALFNALEKAGSNGLEHDNLPQKVFEALGLGYENSAFPQNLYSVDPEAQYGKAVNIKKAFCHVLGYRIYSDLRRGWRIVAPNLEQCGLLHIDYLELDSLCASEAIWGDNPVLSTAKVETRKQVSLMLLDHMRRRLGIKVDYLDASYQERIRQQSSQSLISPWKIDDDENLHHAAVVFPRAKQRCAQEYGGNVYLSPRSRICGLLRRSFPDWGRPISLNDVGPLLAALFQALRKGGLVEGDEQQGFQIPASVMIWKAGDGTIARHDPLRIRHTAGQSGRTNPFFIDLYRSAVKEGSVLHAKEHTAQVSSDDREKREEEFREACLPILYCSPTMELGVDIAQLNAVAMRNVPPTPANYAQRSGRAGRSGQPALILTYCAKGSSHDQHFFRLPSLMVAGSVSTPRLELANEDLVRAHVHAIWLAESGLDLKQSLRDLLDMAGEKPTLSLLDCVTAHLQDDAAKARTKLRAKQLLDGISPELQGSGWFSPIWLDEVMAKIGREFEAACERWRGLYRAAVDPREAQNRVISDASKSEQDRDQAKRLRAEAETQIELLLKSDSRFQADFYSYRYFAGEGFLPGYNFPRLPLSAFVPGQRGAGVRARGRDEYISRPRFLAISEFGPGSFLYHEGSRYVISRVMVAVHENEELASGRIKQCDACAYMHPISEGDGPDNCELCGKRLPHAINNLFRMRNVSTRRRDRISSDEEERTRYGYTVRVGFRFASRGGASSYNIADALGADGKKLAILKYGHGATLWRINLGWANRARNASNGFMLDFDRGMWIREGHGGADEELNDPGMGRIRRVIPYVEDRKNCLVFMPNNQLSSDAMVSLQSALKQAVLQAYQLEDFEIASETLPVGGEPQTILLYESAEGGAGVLRRLVDEPQSLGKVATEALRLCHFNPDTGEDLKKAERAEEDCIVACYDCLMNYSNQRAHAQLDRHSIKEFLLALSKGNVSSAPSSGSRQQHLQTLLACCESALEKSWLEHLEKHAHTLPSHAQFFLPNCRTRPDFYYAKESVAIYIDGPWHDFPERKERDQTQQECMENLGITVLRFASGEQWPSLLDKYPHIFGKKH